MKRRLWISIAALLLGCGAVFAVGALEQAIKPKHELPSLLPEGALLSIEARDFSLLLRDWNSSEEKRAWLSSDNHAAFSNSRLFERLSQAQFDELRQIVKRLNPQCIVWGTAPGQSPNHDSDTVISTWMWTPNARLNAAQSLSQHHQRSQAAGKAFVLNIGPDQAGEIPKDQLAVLMQVK